MSFKFWSYIRLTISIIALSLSVVCFFIVQKPTMNVHKEMILNFKDNQLTPYVYSFLKEANNRGIYIRRSRITLRMNPFLYVTCPNCDAVTFKSDSLIYVDPYSRNWAVDPEFLLYHELGHLLLGRKHKNDTTAAGTATSIMHKSKIIGHTYDSALRKLYIDELFDSTKTKLLIKGINKQDSIYSQYDEEESEDDND